MLKKLLNYKAQPKIKKVTLKDFKKETNNKKEVLNNNNKFVIKPYEINFPLYIFKRVPTSEQLLEVSEHFLKVKKYITGANKDYKPIEKTEHTRKKTFVYAFNGNVTKILGDYLLNIYRQQKFTFKLTIEFSFLRIKVEAEDKVIDVEFDLRLASTNTRPEGFKNPVVVDNKKDIDKIINKLTSLNLVEYFMQDSASSTWKFYRFLDVKFHVYEMNTPIGKSNELPVHFKTDANNKALIKFENYDDYLCFWRCLVYHRTKPDEEVLMKY